MIRQLRSGLVGLFAVWALTGTAVGQTVDTDRDGIADPQDNCPQLENPDQRDSDGDHRGNLCDGDFNNDSSTNAADLTLMKSVMNKRATASDLAAAADMDGDGRVTAKDMSRLRAATSAAASAAPAPVVVTSQTYSIAPQPTPTTGSASVTVPQAGSVVVPAAIATPVIPVSPVQNIPPPGTAAPGTVDWVGIAGGATDVGVGANGAVWVIGRNQVQGGFDIYRRDGSAWTRIPGGAVRIAVDPQGNAWVVNNTQTIFRHDGSNWITVDGQARDIGIGANGTVWVIGNNAEAGGYGIYRTTDKGANWLKIPGSAARISVDPAGNAWVTNSNSAIYRHDGNQWVAMPGLAKDIGVGADGAVWVIGTDGGIYRFENANWAKKPGGAAQIAAGPNGVVWVVNDGGGIYQAQVSPAPLNVATGPLVLQGGAITVTGPVSGPVVTSGIPVGAGGSGSGQLTGSGQPILPGGVAPSSGAPLVVSGYSYTIGAFGTSRATCGVPGTGLCSAVGASFVHNASIDCPSGSFPDLGLSSCWSCPSGYTRSAAAVDGAKACQKPDSSVQGGMMAATYRGALCPSPSFHDPIRGGECYSCPSGYKRSAAHIDAANACFVPAGERLSGATRGRNTAWAWDCTGGSFWDGYDGGACWTCPGGYNRTGNPIYTGQACSQGYGEQWSRATLVRKAECGPGETYDMKIQGTQDFGRGGGCWTCPVATDRTILAIDGSQACERAPGLAFSTATRTMAMTCESTEIFDPINSNNSNVTSALAARNALYPSSPISAASSGGTCWTCPPGSKRTAGPVYGGSACQPQDITWKSAPYNQPGLFGLTPSAEAVALKLVTERATINTIIRDIQTQATAGSLPANYPQTVWDGIATRPQDSTVLKMAMFSRVVAAANDRMAATRDELALLDAVSEQIRLFRVFMAQDALDAYLAWKASTDFRKSIYARSQLQVMTDMGEVPPDFQDITTETILGSLTASGASATAIGLTMSSTAVFKALFPHATRTLWRPAASTAAKALGSRLAQTGTSTVIRLGTEGAKAGAEVAGAAGAAAGSLSSIMVSIGPQIIVTIGIEILAVAIEQQIDIANAEPKLRTNLATATNYHVNFPRLMATADGTTQAQGYWANLMAGPAPRADGSEVPEIPPGNLQGFAQQAAAAKLALN